MTHQGRNTTSHVSDDGEELSLARRNVGAFGWKFRAPDDGFSQVKPVKWLSEADIQVAVCGRCCEVALFPGSVAHIIAWSPNR